MINKTTILEKYFERIKLCASDMVKIKSRSGFEKDLSDYVVKKMKELNYDEVMVDLAGNIIGKVCGTGKGKSVMLNCHLDIVDEGEIDKWSHHPYSGDITENAIWGRGASDTKGTFAIQLYTPYILKEENLLPKGDIYIVAVVHEETSGFGSMYLIENGFRTDFGIVGEATENDIAISNRGRMVIEVEITGKACHASIPHQGVNPFNFLGDFLNEVAKFPVGKDEIFGSSTVSPTFISSSEKVNNTIPNTLILQLDYRNVPCDDEKTVLEKFEKIVEKTKKDGIKVQIRTVKVPIKCYTGLEGLGYQGEPAFKQNPEDEIVKVAKKVLDKYLDKKPEIKPWNFATDSGHFSQAGIQVIGFSPAEIRYCHTVEDQINLNLMKEGLIGTLVLTRELCDIEK